MKNRMLHGVVIAIAALGSSPAVADLGPTAPTYTKDIATILWKNCASCHRQGEVGPFPLLTYADAAKRANFLSQVTESRTMPPWKPEPGFGKFHDERRLTDAEIQKIADWADAGAPEGKATDLPAAPKFADGWQLGEPDLVLKAQEPYSVPASGPDVYRCFVIPIPTDTDRTVAAIEFRPGNRRVVHHALLYLDNTGAARSKDQADPGPGYASFGGPGIVPTGGLGGWAPGAMPRMLPDGIGKYLRKNSDLVLQIHYHPDGKPETDQSTVGIYFTKTPARKIVAGIAVRSRELDIPAGEASYRVKAQSAPLPVDVEAIGIAPHMHYIGKEMKVVAESPNGQITPLIWIKDWDFNWQGQYQFATPVKVAKGSVIKVEAAYDNSEGNPRNPSKPPKDVHWGEQTTDEMCLLAVQVITKDLADLRSIVRMRGNRLGSVLVGGPPADATDRAAALSKEDLAKLASADFPIPERFKQILSRFDQNQDGKLNATEIEAMPQVMRERVQAAILNR
jgi:mono/diheme cytochrome c family protein